jgi:hypothetical protein
LINIDKGEVRSDGGFSLLMSKDYDDKGKYLLNTTLNYKRLKKILYPLFQKYGIIMGTWMKGDFYHDHAIEHRNKINTDR